MTKLKLSEIIQSTEFKFKIPKFSISDSPVPNTEGYIVYEIEDSEFESELIPGMIVTKESIRQQLLAAGSALLTNRIIGFLLESISEVKGPYKLVYMNSRKDLTIDDLSVPDYRLSGIKTLHHSGGLVIIPSQGEEGIIKLYIRKRQ